MVQKPVSKAVPSKNGSAPAKKADSDEEDTDESSDEDEEDEVFRHFEVYRIMIIPLILYHFVFTPFCLVFLKCLF